MKKLLLLVLLGILVGCDGITPPENYELKAKFRHGDMVKRKNSTLTYIVMQHWCTKEGCWYELMPVDSSGNIRSSDVWVDEVLLEKTK